jgi:regulatory protein SWI5
METPHDRMKQEQVPKRFLDSYDTSMEETIKPRGNQRSRGIFEDMRKEAGISPIPSPPRTGPTPTPSTFDSAPMSHPNLMNMSNVNLEFMKSDNQFHHAQSSPVSSNLSPDLSYDSSPEVDQMAVFGDPFANKPSFPAPEIAYPEPPMHSLPTTSSPTRHTHYRRSESVATVNLDETITETGVSIDDIASFISGPDPIDQKWLCLFPDCKKRFGRKENIKSHVQTHLGDRQFQCPHCKKCFVRQHDLKRHAKIHSGVKPYPCQCGNSFARHDALTRHRQRGMCIGAFEGVVKKTVKRGRPRKHRPDNEERIKKSSRTRSKNKAMSSASSTTGCSESNNGSPRSDLDILDDRPFREYEYSQSAQMDAHNFQYAQPSSPVVNNCISPQAITAHSPSAFSTHSHHSQAPSHRNSVSISSPLPSHPASPAKSIHSYHSPPGLCESSSSPAASTHYYDLDSGTPHPEEISLNMGSLANISEHDDEMFLEAFAAASNGEMTGLESGEGLLMGKFEDAFENAGGEDLFRNSEDVFFGSP